MSDLAPRPGDAATSTASSTATGSAGRSSTRPRRRRIRSAAAARWSRASRSGWTIFDNKGRPVRTYEPFFSATNAFEFAAQTGCQHGHAATTRRAVSSRRCIPDNTWEKVAFGPWLEQQWDGNDTVLVSRTRGPTPTSATTSRGCSGTAAVHVLVRPAHRRRRTARRPRSRPRSRTRRSKAAPLAATPAVTHRDSAGRVCLAVADNGGGSPLPGPHRLRHRGQAAGRLRRAGQARGGVLLPRSRTPAADSRTSRAPTWPADPLYQRQRGRRRAARPRSNVAGQADPQLGCARPRVPARLRSGAAATHRYVSTDGAPEILLDLSVYGEGQRGGEPVRPAVPRATTGRRTRRTRQYDYKGNLVPGVRQLAADYHQAVDWTPLASLTDRRRARRRRGRRGPGAGRRRRPDRFAEQRGVRRAEPARPAVTPHSAAMKPDVIQPGLRRGRPAQPGRRLARSRRPRPPRCSTRPPPTGTRSPASTTTPAASGSRSASATAPARPTPTIRRRSG